MARGRRFLGRVVLVLAVMAAAFVGARLGLLGTRDAGASHNFSDVPPGAFYHAAVDFLVGNGITSGCGAGLFCPENPVTRGQVAVFLDKFNDLVEARTLWAVVRSNGVLARASHPASTSRELAGLYRVDFGRDVSSCAYTASLGAPEFFTPVGQISATRHSDPNSVRVETSSSTGAPADIAFHLAVHC